MLEWGCFRKTLTKKCSGGIKIRHYWCLGDTGFTQSSNNSVIALIDLCTHEFLLAMHLGRLPAVFLANAELLSWGIDKIWRKKRKNKQWKVFLIVFSAARYPPNHHCLSHLVAMTNASHPEIMGSEGHVLLFTTSPLLLIMLAPLKKIENNISAFSNHIWFPPSQNSGLFG